MDDDDDGADRAEKARASYLDRLTSGEPVVQLDMDYPLQFLTNPKGELVVRFAGMRGWGNLAAMVDVTITIQSEQSLLDALAAVRRTRGAHDAEDSTPSTH